MVPVVAANLIARELSQFSRDKARVKGLLAALGSVRHDIGLVRIRQGQRSTHQILTTAASCSRHVGRKGLSTPRVVAVVEEGHPGGAVRGGLLQLAGCSNGQKRGDERDDGDVHLHGEECAK